MIHRPLCCRTGIISSLTKVRSCCCHHQDQPDQSNHFMLLGCVQVVSFIAHALADVTNHCREEGYHVGSGAIITCFSNPFIFRYHATQYNQNLLGKRKLQRLSPSRKVLTYIYHLKMIIQRGQTTI